MSGALILVPAPELVSFSGLALSSLDAMAFALLYFILLRFVGISQRIVLF